MQGVPATIGPDGYYPLSRFLRRRFAGPVRKVSLDPGFTCPNADGTLGTGGCTYCDNRSFSPSRRRPHGSVRDQLHEGIARMGRLFQVEKFIAYLQPATNTYAPLGELRTVFEQAIDHPQVVGLAIGTRPDCVGDDVLALIESFARRVWVSLEMGVQSIHDRTAQRTNRAHTYAQFVDALQRARQHRIDVCAHVILFLSGEGRDDMLATAQEMGRLAVEAIKIHNLYVVRDTPLEQTFRQGELALPTLHEYAERCAEFLEHLWPGTVIDRLHGDAPPDYLVAPGWCRNKTAIREAVGQSLRRRGSFQGAKHPLATVPDDPHAADPGPSERAPTG